MMNRILAVLMILTIAFSATAGQAEEEEFSLEDVVEMEEISYDDVAWNFPIDISDMDPDMIVLANKYCLLGKSFVPDPLVTMKAGNNTNGGVRKASGSKMQLQGTCAQALLEMFADAEADGIKLYLKSAYRSWQTQNTMYYNRLKKNNGKDDGWVSKPGASDHQTGLGCDIVSYSWKSKSMNSSFGKTDEAKWMAEHCAEYGFIIRYPDGKEDVTEINYEPWHLRYVGKAVAEYIMSNGLTLEEFHVQLQAAIDEFLAAGGNENLVADLIQKSAEE